MANYTIIIRFNLLIKSTKPITKLNINNNTLNFGWENSSLYLGDAPSAWQTLISGLAGASTSFLSLALFGSLLAALLLQTKPNWRNGLLLIASLAFYLLLDARFFLVLLGSIAISYGLAFPIYQKKSRWLLAAAIALQLGVLAYFKYANFFIENIASLLSAVGVSLSGPTRAILLPLGISFYTFQIIGYLVDVYRNDIKPERRFVTYALYICLLFKMVAGPIERATTFIPHLKQKALVSLHHFNQALYLLTIGALLKFCIADNASVIANTAFAAETLTVSTLPAILAFTLQIFADFSGYSLMAKGLAGFFGINLSWNFGQPYNTGNPSDFWKHWHISLSEWFRDYLYFPLGGSRQGNTRTCLNLILTMALVGLWHGYTWMFIVWGAFHGSLLCIYKFVPWFKSLAHKNQLLNWLLFFVLLNISWVFFNSYSPAQAWQIILHIFSGPQAGLITLFFLWLPVIVLHRLEAEVGTRYLLTNLPGWFQALFYVVALYTLIFLSAYESQRFIYIQF